MPVELEALLKKALSSGANEAEIYLSRQKTTKIDVLNGRVESKDLLELSGIGIRVIKDKRLGFAHSTDLSPGTLEDVLETALNNSKNIAPDEFNSLPNRPTTKTQNDLELFDPQIAKVPINQKTDFALSAEAAAFRFDKRRDW